MTQMISERNSAAVRDLSATALVLGFAAVMWFGWSQQGPPASWVPFLIGGSVVGAVVAALALVLTIKHRGGGSTMRQAAGSRGYRRTVIIEVGAIAVGAAALGLTGQAAYISPWVLFIVGVHYLPLGSLFRISSLRLCGLLLAVTAAAAAIVGVTGDVLPSAVAGAAGGVLMVAFGCYMLLRARYAQTLTARRRVTEAAA